jgi:hypothetical protein
MTRVAGAAVYNEAPQSVGELSAKAPEGLREEVLRGVQEKTQMQAGLPVPLAIGGAVALLSLLAQGGNDPRAPVCARPNEFERIKQPNGPVLAPNEPERQRMAAEANRGRPGCGGRP